MAKEAITSDWTVMHAHIGQYELHSHWTALQIGS
jgi:hypothetical protein